MRYTSVRWSLTAVLVAGGIWLGAEEMQISPKLRTRLNRTELSYQECESRAKKAVLEGNRLFVEKEYFKARDRYLEAITLFKRFAGRDFASQEAYCRAQLLKCYTNQAESAISQADSQAQSRNYEEAIRLCREALEYCPEYAERLNVRIALYEKQRAAAVARQEVSEETLLPNKQNQTYQIQLLLEQGRKFAGEKEYSKAMQRFQEVLLVDPYNAAALQNLQAVQTLFGKSGMKRMIDTHRKMISEVEWDFALPYQPEADAGAMDNLLASPVKKEEESSKVSALEKKLSSIIIPAIYFEDASLSAAIKTLREQSRRNDPEQIGVNIIVRRANSAAADQVADPDAKPGEDAAAPAAAPKPAKAAKNGEDGEEEEEEEEEEATDSKTDNEPHVTMLRKNVPLLTALRDLCDSIKWREPKIDRYAVVLAPRNIALEDMETRLFPVDRDALEQSLSAEGSVEDPAALAAFFSKSSERVKFPEKSRIIYDDKISRLVVTNIPSELEKINKVVQQVINRQDPMVQIMVRIVEVSQNDLKELAFNYRLAVNTNDPDSHLQFQESGNNLLRYYDQSVKGAASGSSGNQLNNNAQLEYAYVDSNTGTGFWASIFALNWASSADVLCAPRVTTLSDQPAKVQMLTNRYFPDEWETVDLPASSSSTGDNASGTIWRGTKADPQPTYDTDPTPLGIEFTITPRIHAAQHTIEADVDFPIQTLDGWESYDPRDVTASTTQGTDYSDNNTTKTSDSDYFRKPRFNKRKIKTKVVVYDGETVVIGGVSVDDTERLNDKIPILGDLPVIGRLFQSKYTKADKRNLLIFITCRLVKPDGTAFYPEKQRSHGLPRFVSVY